MLIFDYNKHQMTVALNVRHLSWYRFSVGCLVLLDVTNRLLNWDTYYAGSGILGQHILNREEEGHYLKSGLRVCLILCRSGIIIHL